MPKPIRVLHPTPKDIKPFALLPCGLYVNRELQQAQCGNLIEFWTDWRHETRILVNKCRLTVNSSYFTFMSKSIYGQHIRAADLINRWEALCINEGAHKDGFSREECMLIEVESITEE